MHKYVNSGGIHLNAPRTSIWPDCFFSKVLVSIDIIAATVAPHTKAEKIETSQVAEATPLACVRRGMINVFATVPRVPASVMLASAIAILLFLEIISMSLRKYEVTYLKHLVTRSLDIMIRISPPKPNTNRPPTISSRLSASTPKAKSICPVIAAMIHAIQIRCLPYFWIVKPERNGSTTGNRQSACVSETAESNVLGLLFGIEYAEYRIENR
jgi:hypothetical protein